MNKSKESTSSIIPIVFPTALDFWLGNIELRPPDSDSFIAISDKSNASFPSNLDKISFSCTSKSDMNNSILNYHSNKSSSACESLPDKVSSAHTSNQSKNSSACNSLPDKVGPAHTSNQSKSSQVQKYDCSTETCSSAEYPPNTILFFNFKDLNTVNLPENYNLDIDDDCAKKLVKQYGFNVPICLAASGSNMRRYGNLFTSFTLPKHLPKDSFYLLYTDKNIFVACPELCFVQAAKFLTIPELVELGCNLCAIYVKNPRSEFRQQSRTPITSVSKLNSYISNSPKLYGIKKARQAVSYITDASNSPMESKLATIFRLPVSHGGYGLPPFEMNGLLKIPEKSTRFFELKEIRGDFVWREKKQVVEYDSNMTHLDVNQHSFDKRRSNIFNSLGYNLITLTNDNIKNFSSFENSMQFLRKTLGLRKYKKQMSANYDLRFDTIRDIFRKKRSSYTMHLTIGKYK